MTARKKPDRDVGVLVFRVPVGVCGAVRGAGTVKRMEVRPMRCFRSRNIKLKLASLLAAGMLFQSAQCAVTPESASQTLAQSVLSVFVSGWVNDMLGVTPGFF